MRALTESIAKLVAVFETDEEEATTEFLESIAEVEKEPEEPEVT